MVNAAANIKQAAAATGADVESVLQEIDRLAFLIRGKEVFKYALQHLLIWTERLQLAGEGLKFLFQLSDFSAFFWRKTWKLLFPAIEGGFRDA